MFIHQSQLRHLLRPDHYTTDEQYRTELTRLFRPAWHPLAAADELARPGEFRTFDLLETPLLLRNFDGDIRAFLNVCPHRHSRLTDKVCGTSERLRCQYHGWEFDKDGRTGKIPDAKAFRPWDRENACLRAFRVERCGELLFVCLDPDAPPLRDWLGPVWDAWSASYARPFRHAATWEKDFPCNWKVVLENSLESYHIPEVHPKTFKEFPPEPNAWHELDPGFSSFRTIPPSDFPGRAEQWIARRLGLPATNEYWHRVKHPHATGSRMDTWRMMQCVFPTGPTSCRYRCIFFTPEGSGPVGTPLAWFLRKVATGIARKVFAEDGSIYAGVQRGMAASPHPGVIGTREERVYVFQKYVQDGCGLEPGRTDEPGLAADPTGPHA